MGNPVQILIIEVYVVVNEKEHEWITSLLETERKAKWTEPSRRLGRKIDGPTFVGQIANGNK